MHKLNLNSYNSSIDFDFFEAEEDRPKTHENGNNYSSKIITKAVIEAKPKNMSNSNEKNVALKLNSFTSKENSLKSKGNDCISSPTSSEEKRLIGNYIEDITLFNCLAFNDDGNERLMCNTDDKYLSDNSLSDSTITTVTSDLTTVSRLSSMSDSSCGSDLSTDSSVPQTGELMDKDNVENYGENTEDLDVELSERILRMMDTGDSSESLTREAENCIESINTEFHHSRTGSESQDQETSYIVDQDSDTTDSTKESSDIQNCNLYLKETSNDNREEHSPCNSLSRKESSISLIEERLGDISLASQSTSNSSIAKPHFCRGPNKFRPKKKELNLTFSREELIRIERDNTILLKKIMAYSKPRSVSLNHAFSHKKTSASINRARQQKKIEQDNYILYSKINAMSRMKNVF